MPEEIKSNRNASVCRGRRLVTRSGDQLFRVVIALVTCAASALAQRPSEIYNGREVGAGRVIVRLRTPSPDNIARYRQLFDADTVEQIGGQTGPMVFHSASREVRALMSTVAGQGDVVYAEPDYVRHTTAIPNDPSFGAQWSLKNIFTPGADISAIPAWDVSTGSSRVVVGMVDTGINYNHPDLAPNVWSAPTSFTVTLSRGPVTCPAGSHGFNALTRSCDPMDDHGHGTHTAGTVGAAGNNSLGVVGVNWTTALMGLKMLDSHGTGLDSDAIEAIEFAIQVKKVFANTGTPVNVRVLSNSWSGGDFSQALFEEIAKVNTNDMLFVAAAGNFGEDSAVSPAYPASYAVPNVISVASTSLSDKLSSFSNFGQTLVHLGAPGEDVLSTTMNGSYGYKSGTSMAVPHVTGAAALVIAACNLDTPGVKAAILNNVDYNSNLQWKTITGGRLNVNKAIRSCTPVGPPPPPAPQPLTLSCSAGSSQAGQAYSSAVVAAGGLGPYAYSILSGAVPAGLTLNASTGALTGVPTTAGTASYTAKVIDSTSAFATSSCSITVAPAPSQSIWNTSTMPRTPFVATSPVNVGMKFRSDANGSITAIRFYKGAGNSGTHVGSLYTTAGVLLAQGAFTGETASGWQQVNFASPVAITAGVTYVASLFTTSGYAIDYDYFSRGGADNAPLHALASGVDGTNGVYLYASSPQYPSQTYASANYWVDVAFVAGGATPPAAPPLSITCASGSAQVGQFYSSAVAVAGGLGPYGYSLLSGFLPNGLTLNPTTGAIVGTPTAAGTANYTALVVDSAHTATSSSCNINVAAGSTAPQPSLSIWSNLSAPRRSLVTSSPMNVGVKFRSDVTGSVKGIRFYKGSGLGGTHVGSLYTSAGVLLAQVSFTGETNSGWQQMNFATPVAIAANITYVAVLFTSSGYSVDYDAFTNSGVDSGPLHALKSGVDGPNGVYNNASSPQFPAESYANSNYWVDIAFTQN